MNKRVAGEGRALCNLSAVSSREDRDSQGQPLRVLERALIAFFQKLADWGLPNSIP